MKCKQCKRERPIQSKFMCNACYTKWRRAGMPKLSFDVRTSVEKFDDACKDGTVAKKLSEGMTQLDIGREYRVAEATVRKYLQAHEIIQVRSRRVSKKMKFDCEKMYDDHKKIALAMPWVKNETPRYYFPF